MNEHIILHITCSSHLNLSSKTNKHTRNSRLPSNGIPPGLKGVLPVAINILSAFNVVMKLSESVTNKLLEPPESAKAAEPWTYVTPAYSS